MHWSYCDRVVKLSWISWLMFCDQWLCSLLLQSNSVGISLAHVVFPKFVFLCCCSIFLHLKSLCLYILGIWISHFLVPCLTHSSSHLLPAVVWSPGLLLVHMLPFRGHLLLYRISCMDLYQWLCFSINSWYDLSHVYSVLANVSLLSGSHTCTAVCKILLRNGCNTLFFLGGGISVSSCSFQESMFTPCQELISPRNEQESISTGICFYIIQYFLCCTLHIVVSWSIPPSSDPLMKMSSVITNIFRSSLNNWYFFLWNISPVNVAPNSGLIYLYLQSWHKKWLGADIMMFG